MIKLLKIRNKKLFILIPILGIFLLFKPNNLFSKKKEKEYTILDRQIKANTIAILRKEKGLKCIGFGGRGSEKLEVSELVFNRKGNFLNIKQARELIIFAAKTYLNEFNTNEKIRPYLINYPFTIKNIELTIFLHDYNDNSSPPPYIASVALSNCQILYGERDKHLRFIYEEPYEKALEIVEKNKK